MSKRDARYEMPFALHAAGYDFYDIVDAGAKFGWQTIAGWGRDGWDLGSWPLTAVLVRVTPDKLFEVADYCEGDVTVYRFDTIEERNAKIDEIAFWWWKHNDEDWVQGLTEPKPEHRGPFSWERLEREKQAVQA